MGCIAVPVDLAMSCPTCPSRAAVTDACCIGCNIGILEMKYFLPPFIICVFTLRPFVPSPYVCHVLYMISVRPQNNNTNGTRLDNSLAEHPPPTNVSCGMRAMSCPVLSCPVLACPVLCCAVLSCSPPWPSEVGRIGWDRALPSAG